MKIKVRPEDFIVEEIINAQALKTGKFCLYRLTKRGENTPEVVKKIAKVLHIPALQIAYAGRKDRHALTRQYITIQGKNKPKINEKSFSLEPVGFLNEPMGPRFIQKNCFIITVRSLISQELAGALEAIGEAKQFGFANYFDDQRLGSFDQRSGFLAEKILKGHFNGALKIYLTRVNLQDKREDKERKNFFFKNWGDWQACLKKARLKFERLAFECLVRSPKDFVFLLQQIPPEELFLYYSAYQAYLWNEVLRRLIRAKIKPPHTFYKGKCADYIFYRRLDEKELAYWQELLISLSASNLKIKDAAVKKIYEAVLKENDLRLAQFNLRKIRQAFFKPLERRAMVVPLDLSFEVLPDEIYKDRKKLTLRFALPRGCFGTMLVKKLFAQDL